MYVRMYVCMYVRMYACMQEYEVNLFVCTYSIVPIVACMYVRLSVCFNVRTHVCLALCYSHYPYVSLFPTSPFPASLSLPSLSPPSPFPPFLSHCLLPFPNAPTLTYIYVCVLVVISTLYDITHCAPSNVCGQGTRKYDKRKLLRVIYEMNVIDQYT